MQTLSDIRDILRRHGLRPAHRLGQCFLIDRGAMRRLLETAEIDPDRAVLEVGAGTGSLTEELLERCRHVVAVELDRGLQEVLNERLGDREGLTIIAGDVLAGKHEISPAVTAALPPRADLVANLPYNIATPLISECLLSSWRAARGGGDTGFDRLTFTVQREVAERLVARPGGEAYGIVSVVVQLLGAARMGASVPPGAFWPRPNVHSRIVRIDFDPEAARCLEDAGTLQELLGTLFGQRRKQLGSVVRQKRSPLDAEAFGAALESAGVPPHARPAEIAPPQWRRMANRLWRLTSGE